MKINRRPRLVAFTLVEVLVVVSIMVVLITLIVGTFGWIETKKQEEATKLTVNRLSMSLEQYKTENGLLPEDHAVEAQSSNKLYMALFGDTENSGKPDKGAVVYYDDLDPNLSKGTGSKGKLIELRKGEYLIIDPWGQPYRYRRGFNEGNTKAINPDFDIWSIGKDGRSGTEDDIKN